MERKRGVQAWQLKMVRGYLLFIALFGMLLIGASSYYSNVRDREINSIAAQTVRQARMRVEGALDGLRNTSNYFFRSATLRNHLYREIAALEAPVDSWTAITQRRQLIELVRNLIQIPDVYAIGFQLTPDDSVYMLGIARKDIYDFSIIADSYERLLDDPSRILWHAPFHAAYIGRLFSMERALVDPATYRPIATMTFLIRESYLTRILDNDRLGEGGFILLADESDVVFAGDVAWRGRDVNAYGLEADNLDGKRIAVEGTSMICFGEPVADTGWTLYGLLPVSEIWSESLVALLVQLVICVVGIIAALYMSLHFSRQLLVAHKTLIQSMKRVEEGDLSAPEVDHSFLEIAELSGSFRRMTIRMNEMIGRTYVSELKKRDAELHALQAQINPHFLYNTLETINLMLIMQGQYHCSRMILYLAELLRYSISDSGAAITVDTELALIEKYLHIQSVRLGSRLHYSIGVSKNSGNCAIPKLLIQPIVENAIVHGLEGKEGDLMVKISISRRHHILYLCVEDNGVGMAEEQFAHLLKWPEEGIFAHGGSSIGIRNVNERIRLLYGDDYGVRIASQRGSGTRVTLRLPAREGKSG